MWFNVENRSESDFAFNPGNEGRVGIVMPYITASRVEILAPSLSVSPVPFGA